MVPRKKKKKHPFDAIYFPGTKVKLYQELLETTVVDVTSQVVSITYRANQFISHHFLN